MANDNRRSKAQQRGLVNPKHRDGRISSKPGRRRGLVRERTKDRRGRSYQGMSTSG